MKPTDRARLTSGLREHVSKIATDLRAKMRAPGTTRDRARQLHADEQVAEDFEVWTDLLSRRASVLWVLKSVYVRVLEDRGLLRPGRLLDLEAQQLFERLAPHLGETAFLRWVYRDLASPRGGVPELFSMQPAEVAFPSDELSRALIAFWRDRDADTGADWSFADEHFEGELMGDLYQDLDPVVKERFALCQTPAFIRTFILDRTLTPAMETFGADQVRLIDPACGSGHFLIDGLKRLVAATAARYPDWTRAKVVEHALDRVVGIDLNDYACALARTRLVMTAAELAGVTTLADAAQFHPHVYWADGLEQVERDQVRPPLQFALYEKVEDRLRATLTRSDVRAALRGIFSTKFHAVVANPPYIVEGDDARKAYHREKSGRRQRYLSAYRRYSLGSPFTERCFQLAEIDGYVGVITSNNFMKREFGKPLIEKVLAGVDLTLIVDTSQAHIPFHGTSTVMLFARNRYPTAESVRVVMGKRGEIGTPAEPAKGRVWSSIIGGWECVGFEDEFVSVAEVSRQTLGKYPWSLGGGGASELKAEIERAAQQRLAQKIQLIGFASFAGLDEPFYQPRGVFKRLGYSRPLIRPLLMGQGVRDWGLTTEKQALTPYGENAEPLDWVGDLSKPLHLWRYRTSLRGVASFSGDRASEGASWWCWYRWIPERYRSPYRLTYAAVATHNHFAIERGEFVFNNKAPVIKLPTGATESDHLALLGLLNSSVGCFWMKQVFHCRGSQGVNEGTKSSLWEQFFEFDGTKAKLFPVVAASGRAAPYAARLDELAHGRATRSAEAVLAGPWDWTDAAGLREAFDQRRTRDRHDLFVMVAVQEELDWLCYRLYGLDPDSECIPPEKVEAYPPTWLPWCLKEANREAEFRLALVSGHESGESPTSWFDRHRWNPVTELPAEVVPDLRARIEARRIRIRDLAALALIEGPGFKRRWYCPDYDAQEKEALEAWLAERVETAAKERGRPFTLEQIVASLQDDSHLLAVCEVLTGRPDFNVSQLVVETLGGNAVSNHRFHLYTAAGLAKRDVWERTWEHQRREDAGEKVTPEVPPTYANGDFLKAEYWQLRGKLDVPKERFVAFTEVPDRPSVETLYGWAGWSPLQRLRAILAIDEGLEDGGVSLADRAGLLDSAWRLLPDVVREDLAAGTRLKAELQALVGPEGPSRELIDDWRKRFPPPGSRAGRAKSVAVAHQDEGEGDEADES